MRINAITQRYTPLNFGEKEYPGKPDTQSKKKHSLNKSKLKLIPAVIVVTAGIGGLSQCGREDRVNYANMERFYKDYKMQMLHPLEHLDDKTARFSLTKEKDSLSRETKNYIYNQTTIINDKKILIKGHIKRKSDDEELVFITVYSKEDEKLVERTIKNPKTGKKYYIDYENGGYSLKNKDGETVPNEQILLLAALSLAGGGVIYSMKTLHDAVRKKENDNASGKHFDEEI